MPCITFRDETEWVETVESGWNVVVGADIDAILKAALNAEVPDAHPSFYGKGGAAKEIVTNIKNIRCIRVYKV